MDWEGIILGSVLIVTCIATVSTAVWAWREWDKRP